jgi:hypothetical protein
MPTPPSLRSSCVFEERNGFALAGGAGSGKTCVSRGGIGGRARGGGVPSRRDARRVGLRPRRWATPGDLLARATVDAGCVAAAPWEQQGGNDGQRGGSRVDEGRG